MPRVYIAGPMTGKPDYNYPAFHEAAEKWRRAGWEVQNPAEHFGGDTTLQYEDYISQGLSRVPYCDVIALLPGWEESNGAVMERFVAERLGKVIWKGLAAMETHPYQANVCCYKPSYCHFGAEEPI